MIASCLAIALGVAPQAPPAQEEEETSLFIDPEDGFFDVSQYLSSRTGFLPIAMPITEPAVGYGLAAGTVFFHTAPRAVDTPAGTRVLPPIATAFVGMGTENESWAGGAGHMHHWNEGRTRYLVGGGYGALNLDWFGQSDALDGRSLSYEIDAWALTQKLTFKLGSSDFFAGPTQRLLSTDTAFDIGGPPPAGIDGAELDTIVSGLGLAVGYDTRNSLFSPTRGTKASFDLTQNDEIFGSDFEYVRARLESCSYVPLGEAWTLGLRGDARWAGEDAPYFDLASIHLRGIQAARYVDNATLTLEAELRWDVHRRWSLVGFGGTGRAADQTEELDDAEAHGAGGVGFRYLLARQYDLRMGLDVAAGSEETAVYVTIGTGWLRD